MANQPEADRTGCLGRISVKQRQAVELAIQVKLEAQETEDTRILEEAARDLTSAVHQLEHARRVLVGAHNTEVWGPDPLDIYATVIG